MSPSPSAADYARAVALLQAGELVAFPTETVYGLGADAANAEAVARIFAAKGRPADHPLIVHLAGAGYLERWAIDVPQLAWDLAEAFWPGPLTLILKRAPQVPYAVTGGQETVGLRVPSHPVALELLRAYAQAGGGRNAMSGIAAPSANRFGRISPTDAAHVRDELGDSVAQILDGGRCQVGIESTIIDLSRDDAPPRLLRPGHITPQRIATVIGYEPELPAAATHRAGDAPRVSGSLDAHYAPRTPMRRVAAAQLAAFIGERQQAGLRCGLLAHGAPATSAANAVSPALIRHLPADAHGYARGFYAALRELDQDACDLIVVEDIPAEADWAAVADRLRRAVCGSGDESSE